jgi:hypothetical protein
MLAFVIATLILYVKYLGYKTKTHETNALKFLFSSFENLKKDNNL